MRYVINTDVLDDGKIYQDVQFDMGDIKERIFHQIIDTREQQTIDALIKLGWTPPPK
jgi:hypothetical protein